MESRIIKHVKDKLEELDLNNITLQYPYIFKKDILTNDVIEFYFMIYRYHSEFRLYHLSLLMSLQMVQSESRVILIDHKIELN